MQMYNYLYNMKHKITDDNLYGSIITKCMVIPHLTQQCILISKNNNVTNTKIIYSLISIDKLIKDRYYRDNKGQVGIY
jgi:hypothetical protein